MTMRGELYIAGAIVAAFFVSQMFAWPAHAEIMPYGSWSHVMFQFYGSAYWATTHDSVSATQSYGASFGASCTDERALRRTILVYDVSNIPCNAIIDSATITIHPNWVANPDGVRLITYALTGSNIQSQTYPLNLYHYTLFGTGALANDGSMFTEGVPFVYTLNSRGLAHLADDQLIVKAFLTGAYIGFGFRTYADIDDIACSGAHHMAFDGDYTPATWPSLDVQYHGGTARTPGEACGGGGPPVTPTASIVSLSGSTLVLGQPYPFEVSWQNLTFPPKWGEVDMNDPTGWIRLFTPPYGNMNLASSGSFVFYHYYWNTGLYTPLGILSEYDQFPGLYGTGGGLQVANLSGTGITVISPVSGQGLDITAPSTFTPTTNGPVVVGVPQCFTWIVNPGPCGGTGSVTSVKYFRGYPPGTPVVDTGTVIPLSGSGCFSFSAELPTPQAVYFPRIDEKCADGTSISTYLGGSHDPANAGSLTTAPWNPFTVTWTDLGLNPAAGTQYRTSTGATATATGGYLRFDTDKALYAKLEPVSVRYRADVPFAVTSVRVMPDSLNDPTGYVDITPQGGFVNNTNFYAQYRYPNAGTFQPAIEFLGAGQSAFLMYRGGLQSPDPDNAITVTAGTNQPPGGTVAPGTGTGAQIPSFLGIPKDAALIPIPPGANPIVQIAATATNIVVSSMLQLAQWEYEAVSVLPLVKYIQNLIAPDPGIAHIVPTSISIMGYTVAIPPDAAGKQFVIAYANPSWNSTLLPMFYISVIYGFVRLALHMIF